MALEALEAGLPALGAHVVHQRDDALLDLLEEAVVEGTAGADLKLVEPDVVGVAGGVLVACKAAHGLDDAVDVGLEAGPVVGQLGAVPDVAGLDHQARVVGLLLGRDRDGLVAVALEHADLAGAVLVEQVGVGGQALEHLARLGGAEQLVALLGQDGQRLAARGSALGRVDGLSVEVDVAHGIAAREELELEGVECREVGRGVVGGHAVPFERGAKRVTRAIIALAGPVLASFNYRPQACRERWCSSVEKASLTPPRDH